MQSTSGNFPCTDQLVSVVMPCHNAERHLEDAVQSVLDQSYDNIELLVVDDGSTDGSAGILAGLAGDHPGKVISISQDNRGPYPARNRALGQAKGEYIAFLDADDYWHPRFVRTLLDQLQKADADLAYCGWQNVGNPGPGSEPYIPPEYETEDIVRHFIKGCPWPIHAALMHRRVINSVNGFSERYFTSMDYDLWLRILGRTRNMVRVPEVLAFYRWHSEGQISSVKWRQTLDAWSARLDFIRDNPQAVRHLTPGTLRELTHGALLETGYTAYWRRDLNSSQRLFRKALATGHWQLSDLKYLLPAVLPRMAYRALVSTLSGDRIS